MVRRSVRLVAAAVPRTEAQSVRELVATQAEEIEDLKNKLKESNKKLEKEKERRARQEAERKAHFKKHAAFLSRIAAQLESRKTVEKEKKFIKGMKQKMATFMEKQQEEVRRNEEPFGWKLCETCYSQFSVVGKHTPRILSCGHTCCFECIVKLAKINNNKTVICPSCSEVTKFNTEIDFPKNFAVLEMCE